MPSPPSVGRPTPPRSTREEAPSTTAAKPIRMRVTSVARVLIAPNPQQQIRVRPPRLQVEAATVATAIPNKKRPGMTRTFSRRTAATPAQIAAFAVAMKMKRPTAAEVSELADVMLSHARRVPTERSAPTPSTWSAPAATASTPSTCPPWRRSWWRPRRAGGQARQPGGVVAVRRRRHAGGARRAHRPGARRGRAQRRRGRYRVLLRAAVSSVVPARVGGAPRDRGADGLQSAWAAYQSGPAAGRS